MRKIFSLLMAAVLSISTAFATTVYCKVTHNWWTQDGAAVGVYAWKGDVKNAAWPGVRMEAVAGEEGLWKADIDFAVYDKFIFTRVNGSGDIADWGAKTTDLSLPTDGKNLFTISETPVWGDPGATGEWSTFEDPSEAIKLTFTYYNSTSGDGSAKLSTVAAIFDAACQKYVDSVLVGTQVYAGRKYKEGNDSIFSNLKLGSSSAAGELKFELANPTEVDSIVFRAAMYANNEGDEGFTVNGENFTLSAGKLIFEDKIWKPTGEVSTIDIVQNKANKGRFFLTSITIYPKASTPVPPVAAKFYVTGNAALVGQDKEWNPSAIKSEADTLELNLEADIDYVLKVTVNGTWEGENNVKGYNELTEKTAGLKDLSNDHNIGFRLAEAGEVKVVYIAAEGENPEIFKLIGDFYVEPTPSYYIIGEGEAFGNWTFVPVMQDTFKLPDLAAGDYMFRVALENGNWDNTKGYSDLTEKTEGLSANEHNNILFSLAEAGNVAVVYNDSIFRVIGNFYVAPVPNYYLIGDSAFVVDAGATADKAWTPDAIPSFQDTTVLNLKAGVDYIMRLSLNGSWENHRDFRHLTDTAAGLIELPDEFGNHSIGFRLNEAGPVTIIYIPAAEEQPEVFKLIGDFYVAPAPDPTVSVFGSMTDPAWKVEVPFVLSDDKTYASLTVENIGAGDYDFKFVINGEWRSNGYTYHRNFPGAAGITENNDQNMIFQADVTGEYTFKWYFANDSLAIIYPEKPEPVLTNGYYLVGKFGGVEAWSVEDLSAEKLFGANTESEGEYQLAINLAIGDEVKVVYVENDAIVTWFPAEGGNYIIDDHHDGATTMYFRPDYQGGEDWFAGCIYVVPTSTVGFENTAADAKAVKVLKNGILVIEKNNKTYNVMGQMVK